MKRAASPRPHLPLVLLIPLLALGLTVTRALAESVVSEIACPSCDDLNPCTLDSCDMFTGTCRHDPLDCDDQNPCTTDFCNLISPTQGGCSHSDLPAGTACNDSNPCTADDVCSFSVGPESLCVGQIQPSGTECDDGDSYTASDTRTDTWSQAHRAASLDYIYPGQAPDWLGVTTVPRMADVGPLLSDRITIKNLKIWTGHRNWSASICGSKTDPSNCTILVQNGSSGGWRGDFAMSESQWVYEDMDGTNQLHLFVNPADGIPMWFRVTMDYEVMR